MLNLTKYIPDHIEDVAFDWNGTLLNDVHYCVGITNSFLEEHQLPALSIERYREIFRFPVKEYYNDLGFTYDNEPFEAVSDKWIARYNASVKELDLFDKSEDLIRGMRKDGVPCAILSAAMEKDIHELLEHHGIDDCFHEVFGLDHSHATSKVQRGKDLLDKLGKDAAQVVLIGDTDHDFHVAQELGMQAIILADGHQSFDRLSKLPCTVLETRYIDGNN